MTETTRDALFRGSLKLTQPRDGYRVNVDAILLAAFAMGGVRAAHRRACDLGSGVGAVGLSLLHLGAATHVTFVEEESFAASLAEDNVRENGFFPRAEVICAEVVAYGTRTPRSADLVVFNPPYAREGRARVPSDARNAKARIGSLDAFVRAARMLTGPRGRVCLSYPAHDAALAWSVLSASGLEPKRARFVHATPEKPARIVLIEAQPGKPGGLVIAPPFVERLGTSPSEELCRLLSGDVARAKGLILEP